MNRRQVLLFLATGFAALAIAPVVSLATVDIVGSTTNNSGPNPWDAKGNVYRVDQSVILTEQEFHLQFQGHQTINYYVYSSPTEDGEFNLIQSNMVVHAGAGQNWYSSGPLSVPLQAGQYYLLGFSFPSNTPPPVTYYFATGDSQDVSFGSQVHGFATGFHPLGPTVLTGGNDQAIYYQRLTTVPEPATWLTCAAALVLWAPRRRGGWGRAPGRAPR